MRIFDSHCHVDHEQFDADRTEMLARAKAAGVTNIIAIGASDGLDSAVRASQISEENPNIFPSAGIHPHDGGFDQSRASELEALVANPKVVGIGETGLDYFYDFAPRDGQQWWFEFQLSLAQKYKKPVIIHCRGSNTNNAPNSDAALDVLATIRRFPGTIGVFHCFTETAQTAKAVLDLGWYISAPGIITFKNSQSLRDVFANIPLERLLVETDAPFLAPIPFRGKRNESSFILNTLTEIARLKNVTLEKAAEFTFQNTIELFQLTNRI